MVRFSDGSVLRLYPQTIQDFGIYGDKELSDEQMQALRAAAGAMSAKMRAVRIVAASAVSKRDLEQRLVQKGEDPSHAQAAVSWMEEMDLLDDKKTAEQVVQRCISRGYGPARAKQALYEKKIPREYWQEALADYPDQSEAIGSYLRSKLTAQSDRNEVRKAIDALVRRGHSYYEIRHVLDDMSLEFDDFSEA